MNIETKTETVTVTTYNLTLTEQDVAAILVDPSDLQERLRLMRGARTAKKTGYGRHYPKAKSAKEQRAKPGPKGGSAGQGKFAKQACPECEQMIAGSQMAQHRARKHNIARAATS